LDTSSSAPKFLVIDSNRDSGELLERSLRRKFPLAAIRRCDEAQAAEVAVTNGIWTAVVLHRAYDADAVQLVRALRAADAGVPIIVVSGVDRSEAVLAAGANGFLNFDQWLMLGPTVANALNPPPAAHA
jgi:DNA-binding response OmpR family regulator